MPKQQYVTGDMLGLIAEICHRRVAMVCGKMAQMNGGELVLSDGEIADLRFARRLHHRMRTGDYRMSTNEMRRLQQVANWLVRQHARNQSQPEKPPLTWDETRLWQKQAAEPGTYETVLEAIATGELDEAIHGMGIE